MKYDKILIAGDLYLPPKYNYKEMGKILDDSVIQLFSDNSLNIVNLEAPVCEIKDEYKIMKSGPNLVNDEFSLNILKQLNIDLLTLANNHIYDFGDFGIKETLRILSEKDFDIVGGGLSLEEASKTYYKQLDNNIVAIVNVAENEWNTAGGMSGGANPFNIVSNVNKIQEAKKYADVVMVIIHGGHEQYSYPSLRMQEVYRFFIDQGADVVIGHHPHCYSGYEVYKGCNIFYSLGNFIFPWGEEIESWYTGFVLELKISENKQISFNLHPYEQCREGVHISLMNDENLKEFHKNIEKINSVIDNPELLEKKWQEYLNSIYKYNMGLFSLMNIIPNKKLRGLLRKMGFANLFLPKGHIVRILNQIRCESHLETSIGSLKQYLKLQ